MELNVKKYLPNYVKKCKLKNTNNLDYNSKEFYTAVKQFKQRNSQ